VNSLIQEERARRSRIDAAHLTAKDVDKLWQVFDPCVLKEFPYRSGVPNGIAVWRGAELGRDILASGYNALSSNEYWPNTLDFDRGGYKDHQR
jgi:hypothetical protein